MSKRQKGNQSNEECYECEIVNMNLQIDCPQAPSRPPNVHRHQCIEQRWICLTTDSAQREPAIREAITGKYLFFSADQSALLNRELIQNDFHVAKIPARNPPGKDYVLCLYDSDDSRRNELASRVKTDYADLPVKYRYWKSNDDSRAGKYSARFLSSMPD